MSALSSCRRTWPAALFFVWVAALGGCETPTDQTTSDDNSTRQPMSDTNSDDSSLRPLDARARFEGYVKTPFESQVIRDQSDYDKFVDHIPDTKMQKRPREPSDDPLLDKPAIDFDTEVLVVATCPTFYCDLEFRGIRRDDDAHTVVAKLIPENEKHKRLQRAYNTGNYRAVVVSKGDPPIELTVEK